MHVSPSPALQTFNHEVALKFQLYNSLFTSLPFHRIERTGILLSLLLSLCEDGFQKKQSPRQILEDFFQRHTHYQTEQQQLDLLFRFVQYAERQVVLFDALEDAAFAKTHDLEGKGSLKELITDVEKNLQIDQFEELLQHSCVRLVLTAHPTQFYPGSVLGIINDLSKAVSTDNIDLINQYLQQLGKTPFFKKQKPTPFDEAISLIWYLENVFYPASGRILQKIKKALPDWRPGAQPIVQMGFWPGGDRDGNPFVTAPTTLQVADALRGSIVKCYYTEVRRLKRRLTFEGVEQPLAELEKKLYNNLFIPGYAFDLTVHEIVRTLQAIRHTLIHKHNGLFVNLLNHLLNRVELFGLHFASLDIRQDSSVHGYALNYLCEHLEGLPHQYAQWSIAEKMNWLQSIESSLPENTFDDPLVNDTLATMRAVRTIQQLNGEGGCHRYIISQCTSALNVLEVWGLFRLSGWLESDLPIDIVPLFETIQDLQSAHAAMEALYTLPQYRTHLTKRGNKQTIMLGFSDGTKDGGYLMANFSIYKAKEALTQLSQQYGIEVVFFDGRGGPPARGGGKTHQFYASMGNNIANKEIQLTVQGQTVSSNFGTVDAAQFNIEQLLHAGMSSQLQNENRLPTFSPTEDALLAQMAQLSFNAYVELKEDPLFLEYLSEISPLRYYSATNIGSRPAKRGSGNKLTLKDLRAIPFVGSWSQLKQNLTGYYGVGAALQAMEENGQFAAVKEFYQTNKFFRTLMDNCEMALQKCFFPLTAYLEKDQEFGPFWSRMYEEYERTIHYLRQLSGRELMANYPTDQLSVQMRERIVLPLTTIQQYALQKIRESDVHPLPEDIITTLEKLVMRCSFGIINAGRNSA